jgi:hypothetical protein
VTDGFEAFKRAFGKPKPMTAAAANAIDTTDDLAAAIARVGAGVFAAGLVSFMSVREQGVSLDGWPVPTSEQAAVFASSAFGTMFAMGRSGIWVIDTIVGTVFDTDLSIEELLGQLASDESQQGSLDRAGFERWLAGNGPIADNQVLSPQPLPALGGSGAFDTLRPVSLRTHADLARQILFE